MSVDDPEILNLVQVAAAGDATAWDRLLADHRQRLRRVIAARLDPRVSGRLDASDVLQEAYLSAGKQLERYAANPRVPFFIWLRGIAFDRIMDLHDRHVRAERRTVSREAAPPALSDESAIMLGQQFMTKQHSPGAQLVRQEVSARVHWALAQLVEAERELLIQRYLEQLSVREIASLQRLSESAVKMRCLRSIDRLRQLLESYREGLT
jgi:RNA polymerase sigma-70 factor (ECF subfamily)